MSSLKHVDFEVPGFGELGTPLTEPDYPSTVMAMSPLAYYRLGEAAGPTAVDQTGNHNATYVGSPTPGAAGALARDLDKAVTLDGVDQYADVGTLGSWGSGWTAGASFVCWIKTTTTSPDMVMGSINDGTDMLVFIRLNSSSTGTEVGYIRHAVRFGSGGVRNAQADNAGINDGQWHMLAVTWRGGDAIDQAVYADGEALELEFVPTSEVNPGAASNLQYPLLLGGANNRGSLLSPLDGSLDEVAIWGRVLSADQISTLYRRGLGVFKP